MSVGEYVLIFNSIIIGLAVADVLISFHRLLRARARVKWFWMPPSLGVLMLVLAVNAWWGSYALFAHLQTMSMVAYLPILTLFALLFLMLAAVLPDEVPSDGLDLRIWFVANARYFWILWALNQAVLLIWLASRQFPSAEPTVPFLTGYWINVGMLCGALLIVWFRRLWLDSIYVVLMLAVTVRGALHIALS